MPKHYDQHELDRLRDQAHRGPQEADALRERERAGYDRVVTALDAIRALSAAGYRVDWQGSIGGQDIAIAVFTDGPNPIAALTPSEGWLEAGDILRIDRLLAGRHPDTGHETGFPVTDYRGYWKRPLSEVTLSRVA